MSEMYDGPMFVGAAGFEQIPQVYIEVRLDRGEWIEVDADLKHYRLVLPVEQVQEIVSELNQAIEAVVDGGAPVRKAFGICPGTDYPPYRDSIREGGDRKRYYYYPGVMIGAVVSPYGWFLVRKIRLSDVGTAVWGPIVSAGDADDVQTYAGDVKERLMEWWTMNHSDFHAERVKQWELQQAEQQAEMYRFGKLEQEAIEQK